MALLGLGFNLWKTIVAIVILLAVMFVCGFSLGLIVARRGTVVNATQTPCPKPSPTPFCVECTDTPGVAKPQASPTPRQARKPRPEESPTPFKLD